MMNLTLRKQEIVNPENVIEVPDMELFHLFDEIEETSGRNAKLDLLSQANERQQSLIELGLNSYKQFHITKWSHFGIHRDDYGTKFQNDGDAYDAFIELINYAQNTNRCSELEQRADDFFSRCNTQQEKWFSRVLTKDLRMGIQVKSVNKVFKDLVPEFEVMLAEKAEKDFSNVDFHRPLAIERKYDGFRVLVFYREDGIVEVVGRSGKEILNAEFVRRVSEPKDKLKGWVLDGEGYCHSLSFEEFSGKMRKEDAKLPADFGFYVFDAMMIDEWDTKSGQVLVVRLKNREAVCRIGGIFFVNVQSVNLTGSIDYIGNIQGCYERYLEEGYEGAMLKYLDAPYNWGRSDAMLKIKPQDFVDAMITGVYEGKTGKNIGRFGGFVCEDEKGNVFHVGGGYKDYERDEFWKNKQSYIGRWIECSFVERTVDDKLRHGNFERFTDAK